MAQFSPAEWAIIERLLSSTDRERPGRTIVDAIYYLADSFREIEIDLSRIADALEKQHG